MEFWRIALMAVVGMLSLASCSLDDGEDEVSDKVEQVTLYVSAETSTYYGLFDSNREHPMEGMQIQEKGATYWRCVHFQTVTGFTYEKGNAYELLVKKTTLANPPQDSGNVRYELIRIVSKEKK